MTDTTKSRPEANPFMAPAFAGMMCEGMGRAAELARPAMKVAACTNLEVMSRAGHRAICDHCGEEILNEREVLQGELTLCRHCAHGGYYHLCEDAADYVMPLTQFALHALR